MTSNRHPDPWHFSHLEHDYFLRIAQNLRAMNIRKAEIEDVYIGCTGVAYVEKRNGRKVNPNWCIRMRDGKEFKYGVPTRNSLEPGLWDLSKCIHYKWSEIVDYKWFPHL